MRLWFARRRLRKWDERVAEARAAYQASLDNTPDGMLPMGDGWWERKLTRAIAAQALWKHRVER